MKTYKLYNNTVEMVFDEDKHLYTVNGKKVDGTTSVLNVIAKPALMYWGINQTVEYLGRVIKPGQAYDELEIKEMLSDAKYAHKKVSGKAADIGSMVHDFIKDRIAGKNPEMPVNEQARNSINSFSDWVRAHDVKFIESERVLYSKKLGYAGTVDFIAEIKGKLWLGDFKTSSGIWDEYWFQTAAYRQAYVEEFPKTKIKGEIIVRIGKDASLEVKDTSDPYVTPYGVNKLAFNNALKLYRTLNQLKDYKFAEKRNGNNTLV